MEELKWPDGVFPDIPAPKPGELTVIAAPRGSGKTTFAVNLARAWGRELKVVLCVPRIEMLPWRLWCPPASFHIETQRGGVQDLHRDLISGFGPHGLDVLILDEVCLYPKLAGPVVGEWATTLKQLAEAFGIPVIAIVNRSSAVDAVLAADSLLVTDGKVSAATKEPGVGVRWFGGDDKPRSAPEG